MAILRYILRRAIRHWQLFFNLSLGVIFATSLLASGPLLTDTVLEIGLRHRFSVTDAAVKNLRFNTHAVPDPSQVAMLDTTLRADLAGWLGARVQQTHLLSVSPWMKPWVNDIIAEDDRVGLASYEGLVDHVTVIAGAWPTTASQCPNTVDVVIGEATAITYGLDVGDTLALSTVRDGPPPSIWLYITGIIRPTNPDDSFWSMANHPLRPQHDAQGLTYHYALVPENQLFPIMGACFPDAQLRLLWEAQLKPQAVTYANLTSLHRQVNTMMWDLSHDNRSLGLTTGLDDMLTAFIAEARVVRIPLYMLVIDIAVAVLYYVIMMSRLSVTQAEREFSILRSRGAAAWQIMAIQGVEALLLAIVALVSGPGLAILVVRANTALGVLAGVTPPDWQPHLIWTSWLAAAIGVATCVIGMMIPAALTLRHSITVQRQIVTRPPRKPWWQRYYVDVILLAISIVLLWRFEFYGGILSGGHTPAEIDWLLLLSPLILLLGSATILLRLVPWLFWLISRLVDRGNRLVPSLAMWHVSRDPSRVVLLVLLLTLAMSLGILSSAVSTALNYNEWDRAQYAVGGDLRLVTEYPFDPPNLLDDPDVLAMTRVTRTLGTIDMWSLRYLPRFEVLAVDPEMVKRIAVFRDDFAAMPVADALNLLVTDDYGMPDLEVLPGQPASIGVWAWAPRDKDVLDHRHPSGFYSGDSDVERITLSAELRTARGSYISLDLQPVTDRECPSATGSDNSEECRWVFFAGDLPSLPPASYPLALHAIVLHNHALTAEGMQALGDLNIALDDISVSDPTGCITVIEPFNRDSPAWHLQDTQSTVTDEQGLSHTGPPAPYLHLRANNPVWQTRFSPFTQAAQMAIPALASPAFMDAAALSVGDEISAWIHSTNVTLRVVGTITFFPTMYENYWPGAENVEAGFAILPQDMLLWQINSTSPGAVNPNEVWLTLRDGGEVSRAVSEFQLVDRALDVETVYRAIQSDPMALGLRTLTFVGYVFTGVLSIVGFVTHFYVSAQQRSAIYGLLRAMGFSRRQLYASLALEQAVLVLSGLLLGTVLGGLLVVLVLSDLPITLGELPPVPPFEATINWLAVGRLYVILGGALLIAITIATVLLWRARIHRVLRIGEE